MSDPQDTAPASAPAAPPAAAPKQPSLFQTAAPAPAPAPSIPVQVIDEIAAARKAVAEREAELAKRDALLEEMKANLAKMTEQVGLTEREKAKIADERKAEAIRAAVRMAAIEHQAIDPDDVVDLLARKFDRAEDGRVVADDGKTDPSAYVKDWLAKKPAYAKPRVAQGAGASPFPVPAPGQPAPVDMSTPAGLTRLVRMMTYRQPPGGGTPQQ